VGKELHEQAARTVEELTCLLSNQGIDGTPKTYGVSIVRRLEVTETEGTDTVLVRVLSWRGETGNNVPEMIARGTCCSRQGKGGVMEVLLGVSADVGVQGVAPRIALHEAVQYSRAILVGLLIAAATDVGA